MNTNINPTAKSVMRACLQKIATGPELSKNLSEEESRQAMSMVLDGSADEVQAAIFLIALRMKRETNAELRGALRALLDSSVRVTADVNEVLNLADPFDGYIRSLPAAPFLPAVLSSCGIATVSQGAESMGPKFGATHRKILEAANVKVELDARAAAKQVADRRIGWAYIDQRCFCPPLHSVRELRTRIVKRSCLTTLEVLLGPIWGQRNTHLLTGYVHKPYPPIYSMLARVSGYTSAMIVRGIEGGVTASLSQPSKLIRFFGDGKDEEMRLDPAEAGIRSETRGVPLPQGLELESLGGSEPDSLKASVNVDAVVTAAATAGLEALGGNSGPMRDSLLYSAAQCLLCLNRAGSLREGVEIAARGLDSGSALRRFEAS